MKKLFSTLAIALMLFVASCSSKPATETTDTVAVDSADQVVVVDTVAVDTVAVDTVATAE